MSDQYLIMAIGFLAQGFYSARVLVQWILSEKAKQVLSPSLFWIFSLAGAYLLCLYGWLRHDFAIVVGPFISYYVYLWNLKVKNVWDKVPRILRWILAFSPFLAIIFVLDNADEFIKSTLQNKDIPIWLVIYGSVGQVYFSFRFIYQWLYSRRKGVSELPVGFWIISLTGALMIVSYGVIRQDIVIIIGQACGIVTYVRNLCILHNQKA